MVNCLPLQYIHPLEAEAYRETVRAIRIIGRDCIKKRIAMVESGEEVPNDILTHILGLACKPTTDTVSSVINIDTRYIQHYP